MAVFNIHRCLLLTTLLIVFCILHDNSEAEAAAAAILLTKNSIDLPFGNSLIRTVNGNGVQIYECEQNSNATGLQYTLVGAMATLFSLDGICIDGNYTSLFSPDGNCGNGNPNSVGYHYFLSQPLALGGKPTFAFSMKAGDPISAIPESTVTCNAFAQKMLNSEDVDDLLLKAVSHSQQGSARGVSYVQRMHSKGGVPPSSQCEVLGKQIQIPYTAQYLFWKQDRSLPMRIPAQISVSQYFSPLFSFYSEGIQFYRFNGSSWINFNVSSYLYTSPGQEAVGWHYFSTKPDQNGGQPSWELFMPLSRVTVKVVSSITVDSDSIDWTEMKATSHGGNKNGLLENVKYMQRLSTVGGLPPQITSGSAVVGEEYTSPFSTIYWFYV